MQAVLIKTLNSIEKISIEHNQFIVVTLTNGSEIIMSAVNINGGTCSCCDVCFLSDIIEAKIYEVDLK